MAWTQAPASPHAEHLADASADDRPAPMNDIPCGGSDWGCPRTVGTDTHDDFGPGNRPGGSRSKPRAAGRRSILLSPSPFQSEDTSGV